MANATLSFEPTPPIPAKVLLELTHTEASLIAVVIAKVGGEGTKDAHNSIYSALRAVGYDYEGNGKHSALARQMYDRARGSALIIGEL